MTYIFKYVGDFHALGGTGGGGGGGRLDLMEKVHVKGFNMSK